MKSIMYRLPGPVLWVVLMISVFGAYAQDTIPMIEKNDIPALRTFGRETFNDSSLWGHINGGADLYLEYGFVQLKTQNLMFQGNMINIEGYLMKDEAAAYGIFSASHLNCQKRSNTYRYTCLNRQQVQFVRGRLYYSITSSKVNPGATEACEKVASILLTRIDAVDFVPAKILSEGVLKEGLINLKLIRGTLGFQNAYPDWQDKFDGFQNVEVQLIPFDFPQGTFTASMLEFSSEADLEKFILTQKMELQKKNKYETTDGKFHRCLIKLSEKSAYFQESWGSSLEIDAIWEVALKQVRNPIPKD